MNSSFSRFLHHLAKTLPIGHAILTSSATGLSFPTGCPSIAVATAALLLITIDVQPNSTLFLILFLSGG